MDGMEGEIGLLLDYWWIAKQAFHLHEKGKDSFGETKSRPETISRLR